MHLLVRRAAAPPTQKSAFVMSIVLLHTQDLTTPRRPWIHKNTQEGLPTIEEHKIALAPIVPILNLQLHQVKSG